MHSYYLVIENNLTVPSMGDILVSNSSYGFIETVVAVHDATEDTFYVETKLKRCNENSRLASRRSVYEHGIPVLNASDGCQSKVVNRCIRHFLNIQLFSHFQLDLVTVNDGLPSQLIAVEATTAKD